MAERRPETAPRILGLTGPIACGKTTVGGMLLELGASQRIDADEVVHELMEAGTETTRRIERAFGPEVIAPSGAVDRAALALRVFGDAEKLRRLEEIVHPAVRPSIRARIARSSGEGVIVLDAVKLLQSDLAPLCTAIWVVVCDRKEEFRRLTEDRRMSPRDADDRLAAQPSFDDPRVSAVIDNSGPPAGTRQRVEALWREFASPDRSAT